MTYAVPGLFSDNNEEFKDLFLDTLRANKVINPESIEMALIQRKIAGISLYSLLTPQDIIHITYHLLMRGSDYCQNVILAAFILNESMGIDPEDIQQKDIKQAYIATQKWLLHLLLSSKHNLQDILLQSNNAFVFADTIQILHGLIKTIYNNNDGKLVTFTKSLWFKWMQEANRILYAIHNTSFDDETAIAEFILKCNLFADTNQVFRLQLVASMITSTSNYTYFLKAVANLLFESIFITEQHENLIEILAQKLSPVMKHKFAKIIKQEKLHPAVLSLLHKHGLFGYDYESIEKLLVSSHLKAKCITRQHVLITPKTLCLLQHNKSAQLIICKLLECKILDKEELYKLYQLARDVSISTRSQAQAFYGSLLTLREKLTKNASAAAGSWPSLTEWLWENEPVYFNIQHKDQSLFISIVYKQGMYHVYNPQAQFASMVFADNEHGKNDFLDYLEICLELSKYKNHQLTIKMYGDSLENSDVLVAMPPPPMIFTKQQRSSSQPNSRSTSPILLEQRPASAPPATTEKPNECFSLPIMLTLPTGCSVGTYLAEQKECNKVLNPLFDGKPRVWL